jgi:flagellar basal body-associated protein FliL
MATPRAQRIGIWIITIVLFVGAVGMYFVMILANNNDTREQEKTVDTLNSIIDNADT